ncbi:MAG TPA: ABC transporter permease [Gemmatimonadaceae bacterium]|nr:ABC transporter permease [Gemmatimonadaceae bacterium]
MDALLKDLRFAARSLRKNPAFAATALLTLALGIGASTAIFSVVDAVLLQPLPYPHAERLVLVWGELRARNVLNFPFSPPDFKDLKDQGTLFEDFGAVTTGRGTVTGNGGEPEQVTTAGATTNIFRLLGGRIEVGRDFTDNDGLPQPRPPQAVPGTPPAPPGPRLPLIAILSHGFWQRRYGGDREIVGKAIDVGGGSATVVGVLQPGFELLFPPKASIERTPDIWFAQRIDYENSSRKNVFLRVIGRMKAGVTLAQAQAQANGIAADLRRRFPIDQTANFNIDVDGMHDNMVAEVKPAIVALMGAVVFVLLIACANVANLLLVRSSVRERELAVRAALGGSPWRLVRQMFAESVLLAGGGAVLGLALAQLGIRLLIAMAPANLPRLDTVSLDPFVLAFTILCALVSAVLFGVVPAWRASRPDLAEVLRAAGRSPGLGGAKLLRNGVVTAEVALSFILLIGSGLMVRSFVALSHIDPGYDPDRVLTFTLANPRLNKAEAQAVFKDNVHARLLALPGVRSVTVTSLLPLDGSLQNARYGTAEAAADPAKFRQATTLAVYPGYFETMRTKLIAGRAFTMADNRDSATVVVIDNLLAAKTFPGQNAVGKRLLVRVRTEEPEWFDVIGVVEHERHESLASEGREEMFFTDGVFNHFSATTWVVRTNVDPTTLTAPVRAAIREIDPSLVVADVKPYAGYVDRAMAPTRFALVLIGIFASIAVILAAVGLYGVLATLVRMRTAEIGLRMAFGAQQSSIMQLIVGQGLRLSATGIVIGGASAFALTKVMRSMLVGVSPDDPLTFVAIVLLFVVIAILASWVPARRAAGLDPTIALREE